MTTLLTARRQNFPAPFGFHSGAEAMRLMAPAHFGLKGAFGQRCSSQQAPDFHATQGAALTAFIASTSKTLSVSDPQKRVKNPSGIGE